MIMTFGFFNRFRKTFAAPVYPRVEDEDFPELGDGPKLGNAFIGFPTGFDPLDETCKYYFR